VTLSPLSLSRSGLPSFCLMARVNQYISVCNTARLYVQQLRFVVNRQTHRHTPSHPRRTTSTSCLLYLLTYMPTCFTKCISFCRPTQCVGAACAGATWLCRFLSVTLRYCAQTTESIIMRPSPDCSPAILVFPTPNMNPIALGNPLAEGVKCERGR